MATPPLPGPDWAAIYTEHGPAMRITARSVVGAHETLGQNADDIVGDVLQELMVKGLPAEVTNLRGLLTTRTRQRAVDLVRRGAADGRAVDKVNATPVAPDWEGDIETEILTAAAVQALDGLPERERFAIEQRVMLDRTLKDVGHDLGVSGPRVTQLINAGLARLRTLTPFAQLGRNEPTVTGLDATGAHP